MKDKDLFETSRRIATFVAQADDPCNAMAEVVRALFDDKTPGDEILKIFTGAVIFMANSLDTAAQSTVGALLSLLVLLYPNRSIDELTSIAAEMLKPESRHTHVERHVFIFTKRGE